MNDLEFSFIFQSLDSFFFFFGLCSPYLSLSLFCFGPFPSFFLASQPKLRGRGQSEGRWMKNVSGELKTFRGDQMGVVSSGEGEVRDRVR